MKRSLEDSIALKDLASSDAIKPLLREIEGMVHDMEQRLLTLSTLSTDEKKLFVEKARTEGARQLSVAIQNRVEDIRKSG